MLKPTMHNYSELVMHADATLGCRSAFGSGASKDSHSHCCKSLWILCMSYSISFHCDALWCTVMYCDALWCTVNGLQWNGMVGASCPSQVIAWPPTWGMVRPGNSHHSCHRRSICHQLILLPLPLQVNKTKQITKVLNRLLTSHFQFLWYLRCIFVICFDKLRHCANVSPELILMWVREEV